MKKTHIIVIVLIAIAFAAIVTSLSDASTYATFNDASNNPKKEYHVVGTLNREEPTVYDPQTDPNLFSFHMIDQEGKKMKVNLQKSKPQDFERSEQIVVIGKVKNNEFEASDILMKCPSKYTDGKPQTAP